MKKQFRVKKNEEFDQIIQKGKRKNSSSYTFYYTLRKEDKGRIGISVPKRLGTAVKRNQIKRQVRNMLRNHDFKKQKYDLIIIIKRNYLKKDFAENQKDLEKLLKTVKI